MWNHGAVHKGVYAAAVMLGCGNMVKSIWRVHSNAEKGSAKAVRIHIQEKQGVCSRQMTAIRGIAERLEPAIGARHKGLHPIHKNHSFRNFDGVEARESMVNIEAQKWR